jgi:hypothetical protein
LGSHFTAFRVFNGSLGLFSMGRNGQVGLRVSASNR